MLVLSRKPGESIVIDGRVVVTIVEVRAGKVRIGVEAPEEVSVDRFEVHEAKKEEAKRTDEAGKSPKAEAEAKPKPRKRRKPNQS